MRNRMWMVAAISLFVGLLDRGALAASYQKTDGTIVDPITSAACWTGPDCTHSNEIHSFLGPLLGPEARIQNADLSFADLREVDLHQSDLRGVGLQQSDVSGGNLSGADIRGGAFAITRFVGGKLIHTDLAGTSFCVARLRDADLHGSRVKVACSGCGGWAVSLIERANLSGARMQNSSFNQYCQLEGANFRQADLRGSFFTEVSFSGVNLDRADLRGAYLSWIYEMDSVIGTPFYDGTTTLADHLLREGLQGEAFDPVAAGWINLDLVDVDADGTADATDNCRFTANADQVDGDADEIGDACDFSPSKTCLEMGALAKSTVSLVAFQDNTCEDWSWTEQPAAFLQSAVLTETYLRSANLSGSVMANVDLAGADLTAARLVNANLANANLEAAVLAYAHLAFANMVGANLAHADLESADFANAQLTSAQYDEATVFPSGRNVSEPPWDLPNDVTPWGAGMVPVPEPAVTGMLGAGALVLAALSPTRLRQT